MLLFFLVIALAIALIAIGRGAASGQFREEKRSRDRIARHACLITGITILIVYGFCLIF